MKHVICRQNPNYTDRIEYLAFADRDMMSWHPNRRMSQNFASYHDAVKKIDQLMTNFRHSFSDKYPPVPLAEDHVAFIEHDVLWKRDFES